MRTSLAIAALAACLCSGCRAEDPCTVLTERICGDAAIACDRVKAWLDVQLIGAGGRVLPQADRARACRHVLDEPDAFTGFREAAQAALGEGRAR